MERTLKCVRFQSKRILESFAAFTLIYLLFYVIAVIAVTQIPNHGNFNGTFFFAAFIFTFVIIAALYNNVFNSLLMFGNTRRTILSSFYITCIWFSAMVAVLSELSELLNSTISGIFHFAANPIVDGIYGNPNPLSEMLWFFTLFLLVTMIAYIYGALCYKIGKMFRVIFWCGFALIMMFLPAFPTKNVHTAIIKAMWSFFGYKTANGIYLCSAHFLITAVILGFILWLIVHHQPQRA